MNIDSKGYMDYVAKVARRLADNRDYVTELDSVTGDGDHWVNMDLGFRKLLEQRPALEALPLGELFKKIGMLVMSTVGGSSGVLYGSAYIKASQAIGQRESLDVPLLADVLGAMLDAIMARGSAKPGYKTMIDPLHQGTEAMKAALAAGKGDRAALDALRAGSIAGMEATRAMEAVKGRATYRPDKGVGHLDPGAVTMSYQLETLADCFSA
ncbi:MAG: dihydroxyacetone kinase subunit DhaL [Spirochaetota bacterium]